MTYHNFKCCENVVTNNMLQTICHKSFFKKHAANDLLQIICRDLGLVLKKFASVTVHKYEPLLNVTVIICLIL